jgi:NAD(P)-dependent dehydrogenase (short-subunit alcohol dehydrogenase family)
MKNIVITGGTRGIGFGLASSFLGMGCNVIISGRTKAALDASVKKLSVTHPRERILGLVCDVRDPAQVQKLWDFARKEFKQVDIWINNAGISAEMKAPWEYTPAEIEAVVSTNLMGALTGNTVAVKGMLKQGHGAVYSLEGLGSERGMKVKGLSLYGTTKAALRYFNDALFAELKGKPVIAGALQPGMVLTDMITSQYAGNPKAFEKFKPILDILSDTPARVTPVLARKILANTRNGVRFRYTNSVKTMLKFITAPFKKEEHVD